MKTHFFILALSLLQFFQSHANTGYDLWLSSDPLPKDVVQTKYAFIKSIHFDGDQDAVSTNAIGILQRSLGRLLSSDIPYHPIPSKKNQLVLRVRPDAEGLLPDGFHLYATNQKLYLESRTSAGLLYGTFSLLRLIKSAQPVSNIDITDNPRVQLRMLNHWDNLDRTVERGYAGFSIFNWHELPEVLDPRYEDYARANASVGINATALTNVNANALVLRADYIEKAAALADIFRKYGIRVFLTARFNAPMELGKLPTADPLDPAVQAWWKAKVNEIYTHIPDFGGFLVKANSEGQPGPQDYQRTHADGANMLARALSPRQGVVIWRAFVYASAPGQDRFRQAFDEFSHLDGQFDENVLIQVKNGPIDFQPREPISPLFGAMPHTPVMMEFQLTKEYLGQGTHLSGLAPLFEEVLQTDTHAKGKGSSVANILNGSTFGYARTGMAGVANIGTALNWTGHLFNQADWYAFGRMAWNPEMSAREVYSEWTALSFPDSRVQQIALDLLLSSRETCVRYMTPLGLHHIMAEGHHYGPGPWVSGVGRPDWNSVYYHQATADSIGFDRTATGSNALNQYHPGLRSVYQNPTTCPETFLLWFHRVPWSFQMKSGRTLWEEMVYLYDLGVQETDEMLDKWNGIANRCDPALFSQVQSHLRIQQKEATWWRDACLAYFQSIHQLPYPPFSHPPKYPLDYYQNLSYPYAPGIKPKW